MWLIVKEGTVYKVCFSEQEALDYVFKMKLIAGLHIQYSEID